MVSIRPLEAPEIDAARRLHNRFTAQDVSLETIRSWYEDAPALFVGAFDGDEAFGICLGRRRTDVHAELAGLGLSPERRRDGIGTRLVERFEANAAATGIQTVSVASAGGYVDRFYAANGYSPESVLVRATGGLPENHRDRGFDVVRERTDGDTRKLYVDADHADPNPDFVAAVREAFGDDDAIYIMEKTL